MTVEEKAEEYGQIVADGTGIIDFKHVSVNAYMDGYNEAMRWRDPKDELPETEKPVIVKYRTAKNVEKYGIGKYFNLGIGNPWTIEGSTSRNVIGWRPIE
jgi:hypothetical protein